MPAVKTPSSSLPASPRIGYKPLDIEKVFNSLSNGNHPHINGVHNGGLYNRTNGSTTPIQSMCNNRELSFELAQLHVLGAELRTGLLKAAEALRLVQNNDEIMRSNIESANAQTQKSISQLTKVISAIQDDSNQLRSKFDQLDTVNKEMRQKIVDLEKLCVSLNQNNQPQPPAPSTNGNHPLTVSTDSTLPMSTATVEQATQQPGETTPVGRGEKPGHQLPFYHLTAVKFRQHFLTFLTSEVHFCRTVGKLCQQQQQAVSLMQRRNINMSPTPSDAVAASVLPTSLWQVYRVHAEFLAQMESRMARWGHWGCIGDVFLRLLDNKNSHFGDIYKLYANELLSIFGAGGSPVCAPLLLPFRRLADYVAFLEGTRLGLDADHPDLYNVAKSAEKLRALITRLNEQQLRFLLVADNVAPVGNGTSMHIGNANNNNGDLNSEIDMMTASFNVKPKPIQKIVNGCATISRTRYTQNNKTPTAGANGCRDGDKRPSNRMTSTPNFMLKSRSHGDLYLAQQQQQECFMNQHYRQQDQQQIFVSSDEPATDDDDEEDVDDDLSPNYSDMFDGDVHLTTRSLPRSRLTRAFNKYNNNNNNNGMINGDATMSRPQRHQRNLSDDGDQMVLDCWVSKPSSTMPTFVSTMSTASSSSRPCSATASHPTNNENSDISIPPTPVRSCETSRCNRSSNNGNNEKVAMFLSNNRGGTVSSGSSGSGGSTSGKGYQPLESVKQSLLNLFNGYKKRKRGTIRGLMSPLGQPVNAPQIRIISPPTLVDKNSYNVLNSNLHFDMRNGVVDGRRLYYPNNGNNNNNNNNNGTLMTPNSNNTPLSSTPPSTTTTSTSSSIMTTNISAPSSDITGKTAPLITA